jgi:hypothetical protein
LAAGAGLAAADPEEDDPEELECLGESTTGAFAALFSGVGSSSALFVGGWVAGWFAGCVSDDTGGCVVFFAAGEGLSAADGGDGTLPVCAGCGAAADGGADVPEPLNGRLSFPWKRVQPT